MKVKFDILENVLIQRDKKLPVIGKFGHPFILLDDPETALVHTYTSILELDDCPLTETELRQLHRSILDPQEPPELLNPITSTLETMSEITKILLWQPKKTHLNRREESTKGSIRYVKKETNLPKWNGSPDDFGFFIGRLEMRIQQELEPFAEGSIICLDMIETLPEDKKSQVAAWFEESEAQNSFNWRALIQYFRNEFEDKQAMQAASEYLNRMEQGYHQYFRDFLKDFEYRVAQIGGSTVYTSHYKTMQPKASLNSRFMPGATWC
ncbi:hypothetical protein K3495_g1177 [Podosphaera aphanis]|nr:hypothetical protein K3495_g1177 [Podosphaera aphanis]